MGIWSIVEPSLGIVSACLPLMAPLFRRIKEITARKSSGSSNPSDWTHKRLNNGQAAALQHSWRKESSPTCANSDKAVLTSHTESIERDPEKDSAIQFNRDVEMQGTPKAFSS